MTLKLPLTKIMDAKSALNAVNEIELSAVELSNCQELAFFVVFSSGVSAGAVKIEESHDKNFTGVWALVGAEVTFAADAVKTVKASGVSQAFRARISTGIVGGTVSIWVLGRG